jgi:threonine dehydrogenase-like Zn-dependent dehydrogenase
MGPSEHVRQLSCTAPGVLDWTDVPEPELVGDGDALIRPSAVARCELDPVLVSGGPRTANGFAVGHEAVAQVVAVDDQVANLRPGDLVACSFQLCCGRCRSCVAGWTALCDDYPILSDYGMQPLSGVEYGGMLADVVHVPHAAAMLFPVPAGADPVAIASVADNVADGYRAVVPHLVERPGADVLVVCHGGPSIALYATLAAVAAGAGSVTFESDDDAALEAAAVLGANPVRTDFGRRAGRWPIVVDCGSRVAGLHHALESTEPEGTLHSVAYYADPMTPMPLLKLYTRGIRFFTGRVHSAALLPELLERIGDGRLLPGAVGPTVIDWDDAPSRYLDDAIKLVVAR